MTVRVPSFDFAKSVGNVILGGILGDDGDAMPLESCLSTPFYPAFGRMFVLNGWNTNTQFIRATTSIGWNGISTVQPLMIAAPQHYLHPMVSSIGDGHIFGRDYKWRYRYKNSITGDVSGLSPVAPWTINLGTEVTEGSDTWLGQKAHFYIPSTSLDNSGYIDTIELFRSVSGDASVYYKVSEVFIGSSTYVSITDDTNDLDLVAADTAGLLPNPSFEEGGVLPQLCKAFMHPTSRLWLYGIHKAGPYRTGTVTIITGSTLITRTSTATVWDKSRVGQAFKFRTYGGNTAADRDTYRIVSVASDGSTLTVTPEIQTSTTFPLDDTTYSTVSYEIIDDRDARIVYQSQPGKPCNYDIVEDIFAIGHDADDRLLHIFSLRGVTYGQTEKGLFRILGDISTDPTATITLSKVADEGTTGFDSGCVTPYGWVYVHPQFGIRLFDGNAPPQGYETLGTVTPAYPLGARSSVEVFGPKDQFHGRSDDAYQALTGMDTTGFDPHLLSECKVVFDPVESILHVFYIPTGKWSLREELVFDAERGCWRGPYRRCATTAGHLKNADGTDTFLFGNDRGGLWIDNRQEFDLYPGSTPTAASNTSGVGYVLVNSGASFDSTTYKEEGAPVALYSAVGGTPTRSFQLTPIVDVVNGTSLVLEEYVMESGFTWTYLLGAIRWLLQTGWIDGDEPAQPKTIEGLRVRFQYAESGASTATFGCLLDGNESLSTVTGESGNTFSVNPYSTTEPAYRYIRLRSGSRLWAAVAYGTAVTQDPEITKVIADLRIDAGS